MVDDAEVSKAFAQAVKLLAARARTKHELSQALIRRGHSAAARERALARVAELGYLDDAAYAKARAARLLSEGRYGAAAVVQRLIARGVPAAQAKRAVAESAVEAPPPREVAKALLERRGLTGRTLDGKAYAKAARLLASRGFDEGLLEELLGEAPALDPESQQD
jgi:regulatory protein